MRLILFLLALLFVGCGGGDNSYCSQNTGSTNCAGGDVSVEQPREPAPADGSLDSLCIEYCECRGDKEVLPTDDCYKKCIGGIRKDECGGIPTAGIPIVVVADED